MRQHYNGGWRASWVCTAMYCESTMEPLHCTRSSLPGSSADDYTESTVARSPSPCARSSNGIGYYRVQTMLSTRLGRYRTISRVIS